MNGIRLSYGVERICKKIDDQFTPRNVLSANGHEKQLKLSAVFYIVSHVPWLSV